MYRERGIMMATISLSVLIASVGLLSVAITCASSQQQQQQQLLLQQPQEQAANESVPYWRRYGCFKVGHTRTISIPGCLKFNLSTNACRGYCMSYSVPALSDSIHLNNLQRSPEEIGKGLPPIGEVKANGIESSSGKPTIGDNLLMFDARPEQPARSGTPVSRPTRDMSTKEVEHLKALLGSVTPTPTQKSSSSTLHSAPTKWSSTTSASADAVIDDRDLVTSYSQCCSMMETEEVIVNLRCGVNEIRRLVFKSAKTCECFFCKHI